jgi:hypothetical protein
MYFTSPSYIPQLPFPPPDSIPIHEFLFGDNDKYGRYPIAASKHPFTCGLTGKSYSALEVRERIEFLARALASRLGWSVNDGQELSKVICVFSLNAVVSFTPLGRKSLINLTTRLIV